MHIHILGICGTFMAGLAVLAKSAGFKVTGCDSGVYPPMSTMLAEQGIDVLEGYSPDQLLLLPDIFVVGNVVKRGNSLIEAILDAGLPYISGPQWLAENILRNRKVLAVSGTHGKTTTASMLAWILEAAGFEPGFLIGGVAKNFAISARLGAQKYFVIEADEYDTAFFDKRSKFVHYHPHSLILNNLEFDHADIFDDLAAIERQFSHLIRTVPGSGHIIANREYAAFARVLKESHDWRSMVDFFGNKTSLGQAKANGFVVREKDQVDWWADGSDHAGMLIVGKGDEIHAETQWQLTGAYNRSNALSALLAARPLGVSIEQGIASLASFTGVKRRMEVRGIVREVTVYDDFAHHPTAIAVTLEGLRKKVGPARIIAVIEPRSNTMKLGAMKNALPASLEPADRVFCFANNLVWDAREALRPLADKVMVFDDIEKLVMTIAAEVNPGDHVIMMSNGSFSGIHQRLLDCLSLQPN